MKLKQLSTGDIAIILDIDFPKDEQEVLVSNGFSVGSKLKVKNVSQLHGMMYVCVETRLVGIRLSNTEQIIVNKL